MTTAVYHWWGSPADAPVYANLRAPVLLSIATLRAVSDMPIIVLDMTLKDDAVWSDWPKTHDADLVKNDWQDFPRKLNFRVANFRFRLEEFRNLVSGWRHLSRLFDVNTFGASIAGLLQNPIMYVDSDVFFFRDPLPLAGDPARFCFNGWNTGLFYYRPSDSRQFFNRFDAYTRAAVYSQDVRTVLKGYIGYHAWYGVWDEMILTYMKHEHPELFCDIPLEEHVTAATIGSANLNKVKAFHANGTMVTNPFAKNPGEAGYSRGLLALAVKEFNDNIRKVLSQTEIEMIFSHQELRHFEGQRFSLLDQPYRLTVTRDETGHFHLDKAIKPHVLVI